MSGSTTWFWPPPGGAQARGVTLVPFAGGMAVPDWTAPRVWPFNGAVFTPALPGLSSNVGFGAATPSAQGDLWLVGYDGLFQHMTSGGAVNLLAALPRNFVWTGCVSSGGVPYAVTASGAVWDTTLTEIGLFGSAPAWFAQNTPSGFVALLPAISSLGTMTLPGCVSGAIALPPALAIPSCLTVSGSQIGVGGWIPAPALSGAVALTTDPTDPTRVAAISSGLALLWTAPTVLSQKWTQTQALSGLANNGFATWIANGTQILLTSTSSGALQVVNYAAGVLSLAQTLAVSGAGASAVTPDSNWALVCQPAAGAVQPVANSNSVWSTSGVTAVSGLTGAQSVVSLNPTTAVVATASGLTTLNLSAGVWSLGGTVPLNFVPNFVTVDGFGTLYAAGASGIAMVSTTGALATGAQSGPTPTGLLVDQGRIVVSASGLVSVYANTAPGVIALMASAATSQGVMTAVVGGNTTLFLAGSGSTLTYGWSGMPYVLSRVVSGAVGVTTLGSGTWVTGGFGIGHTPSAVAFDGAGALWAATVQNDLWSFSATTGARLTSGVVNQYPGQSQAATTSVAAMLASGGHLYATSSLSGALAQLF